MKKAIQLNKEDIIKEIVDGITNFKVIPFFGAGMSKSCEASSWGEIITVLKKELHTNTDDYLLVAQEYENKFGRTKLIAKLQEMCELKNLNSKSLENHMKILAMNPPLVYTTNYDNAIEEAASLLRRKYKKIVGVRDIAESEHGAKQIIKFHGDFLNDDSIVFSKEDYDKRLKANENHLDILFRSHLLGKSVLFLGYGFGDKNIDYIFKKHTQLYGTENIPKSYIVSFQHDEEKEQELREKNIITLVLSSPKELSDLIDEVSNKVFNISLDNQFTDMFKELPSVVLTLFELNHLKSFVRSKDYSNEEKYDKIRETLEGKTVPQDVEEALFKFFETIIRDESDLKIKEAILIAFQHTRFRKTGHVLKLCIELMRLTEHPQFVLNLQNGNWGSDVLMVVEHKLSNILNDSVQCRKWMCMIILAYLEGMIAENMELTFDQVDRLLDGLKNNGYDEFDDLGAGYNKEKVEEVIEHYLSRHDSVLRARFTMKSLGGKRRQTAREIMDEMMKNFPKNLNG